MNLKRRARILALQTEIGMRCGDGTGKLPPDSHSLICKCKKLLPELNRLMKLEK